MSILSARVAIESLRSFAEAHHGDQAPHEVLHGLTVDVPDRLDAIVAELNTASPRTDAGRRLLRMFETRPRPDARGWLPHAFDARLVERIVQEFVPMVEDEAAALARADR